MCSIVQLKLREPGVFTDTEASTGPGARGVVQTSAPASHWARTCMSTCLTFLYSCRISLEGHAHQQVRALGSGLARQQ